MNLSNGQKTILDSINDGKIQIDSYKKIIDTLELDSAFDAEYEELIYKRKVTVKDLLIRMMLLIGVLIIGLFDFIFLLPAFLFGITYFCFYLVKTEKGIGIRTEKGEELNKKIEGLKAFLKDYSLMKERYSNEIELWEEYLIYAVLFGQNDKIIEEYEKYIKIKKEEKENV